MTGQKDAYKCGMLSHQLKLVAPTYIFNLFFACLFHWLFA
jgi:hypothetical protein